jgi:hypothetical protein
MTQQEREALQLVTNVLVEIRLLTSGKCAKYQFYWFMSTTQLLDNGHYSKTSCRAFLPDHDRR